MASIRLVGWSPPPCCRTPDPRHAVAVSQSDERERTVGRDGDALGYLVLQVDGGHDAAGQRGDLGHRAIAGVRYVGETAIWCECDVGGESPAAAAAEPAPARTMPHMSSRGHSSLGSQRRPGRVPVVSSEFAASIMTASQPFARRRAMARHPPLPLCSCAAVRGEAPARVVRRLGVRALVLPDDGEVPAGWTHLLASEPLHVPALWHFEVANALATGRRRGRLTAAEAGLAATLLASLG